MLSAASETGISIPLWNAQAVGFGEATELAWVTW